MFSFLANATWFSLLAGIGPTSCFARRLLRFPSMLTHFDEPVSGVAMQHETCARYKLGLLLLAFFVAIPDLIPIAKKVLELCDTTGPQDYAMTNYCAIQHNDWVRLTAVQRPNMTARSNALTSKHVWHTCRVARLGWMSSRQARTLTSAGSTISEPNRCAVSLIVHSFSAGQDSAY
jgi:hypothetical protein